MRSQTNPAAFNPAYRYKQTSAFSATERDQTRSLDHKRQAAGPGTWCRSRGEAAGEAAVRGAPPWVRLSPCDRLGGGGCRPPGAAGGRGSGVTAVVDVCSSASGLQPVALPALAPPSLLYKGAMRRFIEPTAVLASHLQPCFQLITVQCCVNRSSAKLVEPSSNPRSGTRPLPLGCSAERSWVESKIGRAHV